MKLLYFCLTVLISFIILLTVDAFGSSQTATDPNRMWLERQNPKGADFSLSA